MKKKDARLDTIISQIREMKASISQLKSERDGLKSRITQLENEKAELMSSQQRMSSDEAKEIKADIDKQVQELDACLDMLKTV